MVIRVFVLVLLVGLPAHAQTTGGLIGSHPPVTAGKILILSVQDGKASHGDVAPGSGLQIQSAVRNGLAARGLLPFATELTSIGDRITQAKEMKHDYVLRAAIPEWEDYATECSGKPDILTVSLELSDLSNQLVSTASHRKKGSRFALTGSSPGRFVPEVVTLARDRLLCTKGAKGFARPPTPSAQPTEEKRPAPAPMRNDDVIKLARAGVGDEVVIAKIKAGPVAFRLETDDIVSLKKIGISDAVIGAMIEAMKN